MELPVNDRSHHVQFGRTTSAHRPQFAYTNERTKMNAGTPSALTAYLNDIGEHELLNKAEEVELSEQIRAGQQATTKMQTGDYRDLQELRRLERVVKKAKHAKERFILGNLRLVVSVAKKYPVTGSLELEDLIQEGNIGLEHAVEKFDGRKGFKFSTYGTFWIRQAINRLIDQHSNLIRIPADTHSALRRQLREVDASEPELSLEMNRVHALTRVTSLDGPVLVGEEKELYSFLASDQESPEDSISHWHNDELVEQALGKMTPKVRQMVSYRFGLDDGVERTFREIGDLIGISAESARRAVAKTLSGLANDQTLNPVA